jgi:hypothetical protein
MTWDSFKDTLSEWAGKAEDAVDRALYAYSKSDASAAVDSALASKSVTNFVETTAPVGGFVSTVVDEFAKGPPGSSGRATEAERDAWEAGARELPATVKAGVSRVGKVLEFVTRPWVLAVIGGTVVLAIAAPYVTPFLSMRR